MSFQQWLISCLHDINSFHKNPFDAFWQGNHVSVPGPKPAMTVWGDHLGGGGEEPTFSDNKTISKQQQH